MGGSKQLPKRSTQSQIRPKKKQHVSPHLRTKLKKDPGLPNLGKYAPPKTMRERKELAGLATDTTTGPAEMAAVMLNAAKAQAEYTTRQHLIATAETSTASANKEGSCRAFYKEFRKVVEASDILLEVLDARDPSGCRCPDIEKAIQSEFPEKNVVLVLNKIDLIPQDVAERWIHHLNGQLPVVLFTATKRKWIPHCVGSLFRQLKQLSKADGGKKFMTLGVIGYPNVGKSSIINALKREQVVAVADSPGFTKVASEVSLNRQFKIMDCPGIVFSDDAPDAVVLRNAIKVDTLPDPVRPVELILERCEKPVLLQLYGLEDFTTSLDFLTQVARKRNKMGKRGEPMIDDAARLVLKDWNASRIPFYTLPPEEEEATDFSAVPDQDWSESDLRLLHGLAKLRDIRTSGEVTFRTALITKKRQPASKRKRDAEEESEDGGSSAAEEEGEESSDGLDED